MRLIEWLLLLIAAIVLPLTFQAIFARRRGGIRPPNRHAEHYLTARLAEDRKPGSRRGHAPSTGSDVHSGNSPLHEKESSV
jgi:hypothetical protein